VIGVDFVAELVRKAELARELLTPPEHRERLEFACVDASDLPFPDEYFDVVTCSDAFEHFDHPRQVLLESARVLKKAGVMAIDFAQWGAYNGHHLGDFFSTPWCHVFWSEDDVAKTVWELAKAERGRLTRLDAREALDDLVERRLRQFHERLNRLSLARFERFLNDEKRLRVRWRRRTAAHPVLWPLVFVPGVRELASARNVYVLERVHE
jgi:SAM-dependent methyltransferase